MPDGVEEATCLAPGVDGIREERKTAGDRIAQGPKGDKSQSQANPFIKQMTHLIGQLTHATTTHTCS